MRRDAAPPPYLAPSGDPLASLGDRDGWQEAAGGGWTNPTLGVTVRQALRGFVVVDQAGNTRSATSATGALCVDTITRRQADAT